MAGLAFWRKPAATGVIEKASAADRFWYELLGGGTSKAGTKVNAVTALQSSAVMACARMLSQDLAKLRPRVEQVFNNGTRLPYKKTELHGLFKRPNWWQTWFEFVSQMQMALVLRGNAYAAIIEDERGNATSFVPLNPDSIALWEAEDGSLFWHVSRSGYFETAMLRSFDKYGMLIPFRSVLHLTDLRPQAGLAGLDVLNAARESIGLGIAQENLASTWMGNRAQPSGILTTESRLTDAEATRMEKAWNSLHAGVAKAGKTAVFEKGLKWIPLSMTASDMEFLASRRYQLEEIARVFRVPLHMLGASADRNTAAKTTEKAGQDYVNLTLSTYTTIWRQKLEFVFGLDALETEEYEVRVGWDYSILLEADLPTRVLTAKQAVAGQLWTPNEGRVYTGFNPMEDDPEADKRVVPPGAGGFGSDVSGDAPDGAGRPKDGEEDA